MSEEDSNWYYDVGDTLTTADDPEEAFGKDMRLTTREDVEEGRADYAFDATNQWVTGLQTFAQNTVTEFVDETSVSPQNASDNLDTVERDFEQAAQVRADVHDVTAEPSDRHDGEIEITITGETDEGEHTVTVYLGSRDEIDAGE